MLFAWLEWSEIGMTSDSAGGNTGVGRDGFVAGVASKKVCARMTNNSRHDDGRRLVPPLAWKLSEAGDIVKDYGSG